MDRYDRVIRDIQQRTADGTLDWAVVGALSYHAILMNSDRVIRTFVAHYPVRSQNYQLLFVERKVELHDEFSNVSEGFGFELFVLNEHGEIVLPLYEGIVDRDDLSKLAGLISGSNDQANEFFANFEHPGAV